MQRKRHRRRGVAVLILVGAVLALGPAAGSAGASTPGVELVNGISDVYYPGADGQMWAWYYLGGAWHNNALGLGEPVAGVASVAGAAPTSLAPRSRRGHLQVRIVISWRWQRAHTRLVSLRLLGLTRRTRVEVRCRGRGCPRGPWGGRAGHIRSLRRLDGALFAARDRISIAISAPGLTSERARIAIRRNRIPSARLS